MARTRPNKARAQKCKNYASAGKKEINKIRKITKYYYNIVLQQAKRLNIKLTKKIALKDTLLKLVRERREDKAFYIKREKIKELILKFK